MPEFQVDRYYRVLELAERVGCDALSIFHAISAGDLKAHRAPDIYGNMVWFVHGLHFRVWQHEQEVGA